MGRKELTIGDTLWYITRESRENQALDFSFAPSSQLRKIIFKPKRSKPIWLRGLCVSLDIGKKEQVS